MNLRRLGRRCADRPAPPFNNVRQRDLRRRALQRDDHALHLSGFGNRCSKWPRPRAGFCSNRAHSRRLGVSCLDRTGEARLVQGAVGEGDGDGLYCLLDAATGSFLSGSAVAATARRSRIARTADSNVAFISGMNSPCAPLTTKSNAPA
jgi:hypothetical protein